MLILYVGLSHDYSRRLTNKTLLIISSSENNSVRFALDINLWQPWGDFLISPLIHALSSDHSGYLTCQFFLTRHKKVMVQPQAHTSSFIRCRRCSLSQSTQWSSLRASCISITCLMNRGQAYLCDFTLKTWFLFLLCYYKDMNMFNPSWTLHGWNSSSLQWALCMRKWTSS